MRGDLPHATERHFLAKSSRIFTRNDALVNLGIVLSGMLVLLFISPISDLLIGLVVVIIAFRSGQEILEAAHEK